MKKNPNEALGQNKRDYGTLFAVWVFASLALWLLLSLVFGKDTFTSVFFRHTTDAFMDFFNSIRDASLGQGAYTERRVIYPPMANLIFLLFSYLTPDAYNATSFEDRKTWSAYDGNILLIAAVTVLASLLLILPIWKSLGTDRKTKVLFTLAAFFSVPCLNMLERGNMMVLALAGVMVYAMTYHSESRLARELGLLALAFSFSLKLYPILFAWLLIGDRRYKEFFRCALYSLALLILPSFFFGGPICLWWIFENIFFFSSNEKSALYMIGLYSGLPGTVVSIIFYGWFLLCAVNFLVSPFLHRERWKIWVGGCMMFISYPALTTTYAWTLFLIPLIGLCNEKTRDRRILGYFIPILIPFLFFPISTPVPVTFNTFLAYICLFALTVYALGDTVLTLYRRWGEWSRQRRSLA